MASESKGLYNAFFYGTLMHPKVLTGVINNTGSHLRFCPAILMGHTRHKVRRADHPGVVPYSESKALFTRDLSVEETCVRGTLVTGLTEPDMYLLDCFEGPEYDRRPVEIQPLIDLEGFTADGYSLAATSGQVDTILPSNSKPPIPASTYIHKDITKLEAELWSFSNFMATAAHKWYGSDWDESEVSEQTEELWAGTNVKGSIINRRMAAMVPSVSVSA